MLTTARLHAGYRKGARVVSDVTVALEAGKVTALVGPNGAGKSTILKSLVNLTPYREGGIDLDGKSLVGLPTHLVARRGVAFVGEGRGVLPGMTVGENLRLGWRYLGQGRSEYEERLDEVHRLFPVLPRKTHDGAGSLSGGEQQMLALARSLMGDPRYLILDEPSLGLAPKLAQELAEQLHHISVDRAVGVVIAEQDVRIVRTVANRVYGIRAGVIHGSGPPAAMLAPGYLQELYL